MSQGLWTAVDAFVAEQLIGEDPVLDAALRASAEAGLPPIAVSPAHGQMLGILARVHGARRILEVGTLGGYSTIWLARTLSQGDRLVTLELQPRYAEVARANIAFAGLAGTVEVRVGPALDSLAALIDEHVEPFDMAFIDADKQNTPGYFSAAIALCRPGALIVVDNVVREGALIDPASRDPGTRGMRRFHELLAADPRVTATTIQMVGSKGYDGFTLALVDPDPVADSGPGG